MTALGPQSLPQDQFPQGVPSRVTTHALKEPPWSQCLRTGGPCHATELCQQFWECNGWSCVLSVAYGQLYRTTYAFLPTA